MGVPLEAHGPGHRPDFVVRLLCEELRRCIEVSVALVATRTPEVVARPNGILLFAALGTLTRRVRFRLHVDRDAELGGGGLQPVD